jgi:hypothetical protein
MDREEYYGCSGHHGHHREHFENRQEGHEEYCGCGGQGHHGRYEGRHHHGGFGCGCLQHHGGMGFHRHFIPSEEIIARLEEYLKQLHAEAKGVEERIAELRKKDEPQQA